MQRITLPVVSSRRTSDPLDPYVQRHSFVMRAVDFDWSTIPRGLNPRGNDGTRDFNRGVYVDVRESAETGGDFHRKNAGLVITARTVEPADAGSKEAFDLILDEEISDGHLDGVGTMTILATAQAEGRLADTTFVNVEVWAGLTPDKALAMAEARNGRGAVQPWSIANAKGLFTELSQALDADPRGIGPHIEWAEGVGSETATATSADVVLALVAFSAAINPTNRPVQTYGSGKVGALSRFREKPDELNRLKGIAGDVLDLHDYIADKLADYYRQSQGSGSQPGKWALIRLTKAPQRLTFTNRHTQYQPYSAVTLPILAAFRQFVVTPDDGAEQYRWDRPYPELLEIADAAGASIIQDLMVGASATTVGGKVNVNALGKHQPLWHSIQRTVENASLRLRK